MAVPGAGYRLLDGRGGTILPDMNDLVVLKEASMITDTQDQDEPFPPNFWIKSILMDIWLFV